MKTLLLDQSAWDLVVDSAANIAVASDPYSLAQDAASAVKLFHGELYYDTTQGVVYSTILGKLPPLTVMKQQFIDAAKTVPTVAEAKCFISGVSGRRVTGQVQIVSDDGEIAAATF